MAIRWSRARRKARMRELAKRRMAPRSRRPTSSSSTRRTTRSRCATTTRGRRAVVVAKGVDESAEKIREIARQHGVPVLSRPPLARALHKHVKEGRPVPSNLYRAVAEVLAYVYRLRQRR